MPNWRRSTTSEWRRVENFRILRLRDHLAYPSPRTDMNTAATLKLRVEAGFERWGRLVYRWRWLVLLLSLGIVGGMASLLPQIRIDNSHENYLHDSDPAKELYERFRREYGQDSYVMVAITPPEVFDVTFLAKLRDFHRELEEELPHLDDVTSLINARQTRGEGDTLVVEDLLEDWPASPAELDALEERVFANPLYVDVYISRDGELTTVIVRPDIFAREDAALDDLEAFEAGDQGIEQGSPFVGVDEKSELVAKLDEIVARYEGPDFPISLSGGSVVGARLNVMMREDVTAYMAVCSLVILLLLLVLFRRASGVLLPVLLVTATLLSTFGSMVLLDIPFSMSVQMLPIIVMCVVVCNVVHVLVLVYQGLADGRSKEEAISYAFAHSGLAILMTSLTTAVGFASFLSADLAPIQHLGILSSTGVLIAFAYSVTLLPALVGVVPLRRLSGETRGTGKGPVARLLVNIGAFSTRRPWLVLTLSACVFCWSLIGISEVHFSHSPIMWFPEGHAVRTGLELMDSKLSGTQTIEVLVDSGEENGLYDPEVLRRIERAMRFSETLEQGPLRIGKAISLVDVVKETHQALNENRSEYYRLPEERALIAQELLLFENSGSDDLETFIDSDFRTARISMRVPMVDSFNYPAFLTALEQGFAEILGEDLPFELTGIAPVFGRTFLGMISSMARSYLIAFSAITPLMILLIGNLRLGLISMVPNLLPVLVVLGVMGWLGLPLDVSSIVIGSILIGLAVDDTIHFLHRFQRYFEKTSTTAAAVRETMETTGTALLFTSLVLGSGFLSIGLMGTMSNTIVFGFITAVGIGVAFVADIVIAPALMSLAMRSQERRLAE